MTDLFQSRLEIEKLIASYAEFLDTGDIESVSGLFSQGCIRVEGQKDTVQGKDGVRKMFAGFTCFYDAQGKRIDILKESGKPFTRHIISNLCFESLEEKNAITRSCFTVIQALPGHPMQPIISGRYRDTFSYSEEHGWHFVEKYEYIDLLGDLGQHLAVNPF